MVLSVLVACPGNMWPGSYSQIFNAPECGLLFVCLFFVVVNGHVRLLWNSIDQVHMCNNTLIIEEKIDKNLGNSEILSSKM